MKKYFFSSTVAFVCSAFMLLGTFVSAQDNYYQAGVDYVYRSLKDDDATKVSILTVQLNASGVATITRTEEASRSSDITAVYTLAPSSNIAVSSSVGEPLEFEISDNKSQYWLVAINDSGSPQQLQEDSIVQVLCSCKHENNSSAPAALMNSKSDTITSFCKGDGKCSKSNVQIKSGDDEVVIAGGALLIKAQSVVIN